MSLFCAQASEAAGEPLAGTAAHARLWIGVEECGVWDAKALKSPGLEPIREALFRWSALDGSRVQLVRRVGVPSDRRRTVFVARLDAEPKLVETRLTDEEIDALDPLQLLEEGEARATVHWVCTHGKRDRCCALLGVTFYTAMCEAGADVWQTSHLGGHRFAATMVTLPSGVCHGRLTPDDAPALAAGEQAPLERVRGRALLDEAAQFAEVELWRELGDQTPLRWLGTERDDDHRVVRFEVRGAERALRVGSERLPEHRAKSCGDDAKAIQVWRLR